MALCACARLVLLVMVLVAALCLPHVTGEPGFHNGPSQIRSSIRSSPEDTVSVRTVALNVETAHQQEKVESTIAADQEVKESTRAAYQQLMESTSVADQELMKISSIAADQDVESGREGSSFTNDVHRVGKRMVVQRRGLRTSKPYPCSLPAGACPGTLQSTCCGRTCANVLTNRNHCGRCGHVCRSSRACCNGKCRRLATDERNCGRCGARCALGTRCLFGLCGY